VPTFVVGGRYFTSPHAAGGVAETMKVLDYLVERVKTNR
jgi:hypothetical protein